MKKKQRYLISVDEVWLFLPRSPDQRPLFFLPANRYGELLFRSTEAKVVEDMI